MGLDYYLYYIYYSFLGMPFIIRVSIISLSIFVPLYLLCGYVYYRLIRRGHRIKKIDKDLEANYREVLQFIITSIKTLLPEDLDRLLPPQLKRLNNIEIDRFTRLACTISKENEHAYINFENNKVLLDYLNIRQYWEKRLKHGSTMQKRNSLLRLDELNVRVSGALLMDLTYNRNVFLRKRSRSSFLNLTHSNPYKFLEEGFDDALNNWDKIEMHDILEKRANKSTLPNLARLALRSDDIGFQCFMVDEIAYFKQKENIPSLVKLVKDTGTNSVLLMHCIKALGHMQCQEIEPELFRIYPMQAQYVQQAIIEAIVKFKTGEALPSLIDAFKNAVDDERRIFILSAIYNYGEEGRAYFFSIRQKESNLSHLLFKHVSNPLLSTF